MSHMVPRHLTHLIYQSLKTSTCNNFNDIFKRHEAEENRQRTILNGITPMTYEQILNLAEFEYRTMIEDGGWTAKAGSPNSVCAPANPKYVPPYRRAPGPGESNKRMYKGRKEYWCKHPATM